MEANENIMQELRSLPLSEELGISRIENDLAKIQDALAEKLRQLLDSDHSKVVNLLYRIDVEEKLAREAFSLIKPELIAVKLSGLIIQRLLKKAESRVKYRNNEI